MLTVGNILNTTAVNLTEQIVANLDFQPVKAQDLYVNLFKNLSGQSLVYKEVRYQKAGESNILLNYYQLGVRNTKNLTKLWVISESLHNAAFRFLGEKLKPGFIVYSKIYNNGMIDGLVIGVQSAHETPYFLNLKIEEFL